MSGLKNFNSVERSGCTISGLYKQGYWKYPVLLYCIPVFNPVYSADLSNTQSQAISYAHILNLVSGLLVVLAIFLCVAYVLKRLSGFSAISRGNLKIIDTLPLGTRERLLLVKVVDAYLVLGISAGGINTLHVLSGELPDSVEQPGVDFKSRMNDLLTAAKLRN